MAFVEKHLPCEDCGSSDALSIDDNGWSRCFSCGKNKKVDGSEVTAQVKETSSVPPHTYKAIPKRKLSIRVAEKYGVGFTDNGDMVMPYDEGNAAKLRVGGDKVFRTVGSWSTSRTLFGQDKFAKGGKFVVVVEGELDALAAHQMLNYKTPVVSIRSGAQSAVKDIKENYEWLDTFEQVIFCFDNDEAGQAAQKECASIFAHKAKLCVMGNGFKDAGEYCEEGEGKLFEDVFWRAERYTPDGILSGANIYDMVMTPVEKAAVDYPFEGLNKITYGIREGELVCVTAGSGLGKSQFLREIVWHILQNTDENIGLMFMEESVRKTGLSLMSLAAGKPLHLPTTESTQEERDLAFKQTLGTERMFLFDHFGSSSVDNIVNRVRYMAKVLGCKYVFLDHISIIVSAQEGGDERKAIDEVMTKLRTMVQETNIALICVSHLKRPNDKGHEEGAVTSLAQLRGSGSIAQLSDMVLGLERNGQAEDEIERNTTVCRVLKNRFSGETGKACCMLYNNVTGRMKEYEPVEEDDAL